MFRRLCGLGVKRRQLCIKELVGLRAMESESYGGKDMKKFSVLLMILAIVCALFADKIDMAVKGNKKVKKVIVVFSVGVLLVCTIAIYYLAFITN